MWAIATANQPVIFLLGDPIGLNGLCMRNALRTNAAQNMDTAA